MFIDRVVVRVEAGTGGSGCTSFRREHRVPMGGPDGGDGGRGGDIIIRGDSNLTTLLDYTYRDRWQAERGEHGMGSNKTGRSGQDVILPVPPGTVIRERDGALLGEVLLHGDQIVVARGGARRNRLGCGPARARRHASLPPITRASARPMTSRRTR